MTLREWALTLVNDPDYRESVRQRAKAGTLPETVESLLWELAELADEPHSPRSAVPLRAAAQGPTLALIRSSADDEVDNA